MLRFAFGTRLLCRSSAIVTVGALVATVAWASVFMAIGAQPAHAASCVTPSFAPAVAFPVGSNPAAVLADDFNSDGRLDLAVANDGSNTVSVLLGDGQGRLTAQPALTVGSLPVAIIGADFNRDGKPDLATANQGSNDLSVLIGSGIGGFAPEQRFAAGGSQPAALATGDFDRNSTTDVAVGNLFNNVALLRGDGAGALGAPEPVGSSPAGNPTSVIARDFNADGGSDLALARIANNDIRIHENNFSGSGLSPSSQPAASGFSLAVASADLNGDGQPDFYGIDDALGAGRAGVSLHAGVVSGRARFDAPTFTVVGNVPTDAVAADFNGDRRADLALSRRASNDVAMLLADAAGGFAAPVALPAGDGPEALAEGEFTGDGAPDLVVANSRAGTVSLLVNTCAIGPVDLRPTAIEITQAVQDVANTVLLVEDKRTFARVHVASNVDVSRVSARLSAFNASGAPIGAPIAPSNPGAVIDPRVQPDRGSISHGFLFELPPEWTRGSVRLEVDVNPFRTLAETTYANNTTASTVSFQRTKALRLRLIKYIASDTRGNVLAPSEASMQAILSRIRREFPIAKLAVTRGEFSELDVKWDTVSVDQSARTRALLDRLLEFRINKEPTNDGVVYLMVSDSRITGLISGRGDAIPGWNAVTSELPETAAHEIGHVLGRPHTECTPNPNDEVGAGPFPYPGGLIGGPPGDTARFYGFDGGDSSLAFPELARVVRNDVGDEMSYCSPRWMSDFSYTRVHAHIQQAFTSVDPEGDLLSVHGMVDQARQAAALSYISRRTRVAEVPELRPGPYRIRLLDQAGRTLAEHAFTPLTDVEGGSEAIISQVVDFAPGTRRVEVFSDAAQRVLAARAVSSNAPQISAVTAAARTDGSAIDLAWEQSDADGDPIRATVLYRRSAASEWRTLAGEVIGGSFSADTKSLPGSATSHAAAFRVEVDDGLLTAAADSPPVTVDLKAPTARIMSPLTGTATLSGQGVLLSGAAQDAEDGTLDGNRLQWASDLDGSLGSGPAVRVSGLSIGTHRVSLAASDTDGQTDRATATVVVVAAPDTTQLEDRTPPSVTCDAAPGRWHAEDVSVACAAEDAGVGLADVADAAFSLATSVPAKEENEDAPTASRNICDRAGNCRSAGPVGGNKVDKRPPGILTAAPPEDPATYLLGSSVPAHYACADRGSGVASCAGAVPTGAPLDTGSVGPQVFTVAAADAVGNATRQSRAYNVIYDFRGFRLPVLNPPLINFAPAGGEIPVRFSLDGNRGLNVLAQGYPKSQPVGCLSGKPLGTPESTVPDGQSGLTYNARQDVYRYAWKTSRSWRACRQLLVRLTDGRTYTATFLFFPLRWR